MKGARELCHGTLKKAVLVWAVVPRRGSLVERARSGSAGRGGSAWEERREVEAVRGAAGPGEGKGLRALV